MSIERSTESAALRKLVFTLAYPDEEERMDGPDDLFQAVSDAIERVAELESELEETRQMLAETNQRSKRALEVANTVDDGRRSDGGPQKIDVARWTSRDELIRQTADGKNAGAKNVHGDATDQVGSITVGEVRRMCRPEHDLKWQTVRDSWSQLVRRYDAIYVDADGDELRLKTDPDAIDEALVEVVSESLDRSDLNKLLVGGRE